MILAGDIGGTKTLLALYESVDGNWQCYNKQRYASADFASFDTLLQLFLSSANCPKVNAVSLGVAGPIVDGDCHATNLPWLLKKTDIGQCIDTQKVFLLNDLEAAAWGVLTLPEQQFVELNPVGKTLQGNRAVIAAGTGLGEAVMVWHGQNYHIMATEGGHCDFAPRDEREIALLQFMLKQHPEHVSYERLVSGEGLVNLYRFLAQADYATVNPEIERRFAMEDSAAVIGEVGVMGTDALCTVALHWFCQLYGAEAGNLALKCLPYGGLYLAGGIAGKILPALTAGHFMAGFLHKGRYKTILQNLSVKVCLESEVALIGALNYVNCNMSRSAV
jgi:glucokinase